MRVLADRWKTGILTCLSLQASPGFSSLGMPYTLAQVPPLMSEPYDVVDESDAW